MVLALGASMSGKAGGRGRKQEEEEELTHQQFWNHYALPHRRDVIPTVKRVPVFDTLLSALDFR